MIRRKQKKVFNNHKCQKALVIPDLRREGFLIGELKKRKERTIDSNRDFQRAPNRAVFSLPFKYFARVLNRIASPFHTFHLKLPEE